MKQETVDFAMDKVAGRYRGLSKCNVADLVYDFISELVDGANWWQSPILRTVRGYVANWQNRNC